MQSGDVATEPLQNGNSFLQNGIASVDSHQEAADQSSPGGSSHIEQLPTAPASSAQADIGEQPQTAQEPVLLSKTSAEVPLMPDGQAQDLSDSNMEPLPTQGTVFSDGLPQEPPTTVDGSPDANQPTGTVLEQTPTDGFLIPPEDIDSNLTAALPTDPDPEAPVAPASTPAVFAPTTVDNQSMQEAPSTTKIGRAWEDDAMSEEPAPKRPKTDDEGESQPQFAKPSLPEVNTSEDQLTADNQSSAPMTPLQQKELTKLHNNLKKVKDAMAFLKPVDPVALNIPTYFDVIERPMDLGTMDTKLKAQEYSSLAAYIADFEQIVANVRKFNGDDHSITRSGLALKARFDNLVKAIPGPDQTAPVRPDKKKKASSPVPPKALPARRESRSSLPGSARSPTTPGQAFGMNPATGTPIIRRDSTLAGDRPKREIQAPPPRDLPYATAKPQRKKFQTELKFCRKVLQELLKPKNSRINWPFLKPVDPVAENLPTYHKIVRNPMDLETVSKKLDSGQYENAKEFETDMRLIVKNCCLFNPPDTLHHGLAKEFEREFEREWSAKRQWVSDHQPASTPQSPDASSDEEEYEEEEEEVEENDDKQAEIEQIQKKMLELTNQLAKVTSVKAGSTGAPKASKKATTSTKNTTKSKKRASSQSASTAPASKPTVPKKKINKPEKKHRDFPNDRKDALGNAVERLPERYMIEALNLIRSRMPGLSDSEEVEVEIWQIDDETLWMLQGICDKAAGKQSKPAKKGAGAAAHRAAAQEDTAVPSKKKHKPMSKATQEERIKEIQRTLHGYDQQGGGGGRRDTADVPLQSVGESFFPPHPEPCHDIVLARTRTSADASKDNTDLGAEESSDDEEDSEESEEE